MREVFRSSLDGPERPQREAGLVRCQRLLLRRRRGRKVIGARRRVIHEPGLILGLVIAWVIHVHLRLFRHALSLHSHVHLRLETGADP